MSKAYMCDICHEVSEGHARSSVYAEFLVSNKAGQEVVKVKADVTTMSLNGEYGVVDVCPSCMIDIIRVKVLLKLKEVLND